MTPEQILSKKPIFLTQLQRETYFEKGYIFLEKVLSDEWIERLRKVTNEKIEESRVIKRSDEIWDLEDDHSPENPRLRRLNSPNDHHPTYWKYASKSIIPDIVADLVGPNVKS